jgi:hypothetical protein
MTKNKKNIELYLKYLRDVSRKIALRSDFAAVFLQKTKKKNSYTVQLKDRLKKIIQIDISNPLYDSIKLVTKYLERNTEKKMFLGVGLICGLPKIAGPLLVCECEVNNKNGDSIILELDLDKLMINYDLLTRIIEKKSSFSYDEDSIDLPLEKESEVIERIEKLILNVNRASNFDSLVNKIIRVLKENLEEFSDILFLPKENYDYENEIENFLKKKSSSIFGKGKLVFVNANHLFISSVPSEVSVHEELSRLIEEISTSKKNSLGNPILEKLLDGAFTDKLVRVNCDTRVWNEIENILNSILPIPLSSSQRKALKNAFAYEISYIQGPPGTGKSHTITALALLSIFLGKKVLIVSQKPPAVKVVNEKISPYLQFHKEIVPVVYFDRKKKHELKETIGRLLSEYASDKWKLRTYYIDLTDKLQLLEKELTKINKKLESTLLSLKNNLDLEEKYALLNRKVSNLRKGFEKKYCLLKNDFKLSNERVLKKFELLLEQLQKIEEEGLDNINTLIFRLHLIKNMLVKFGIDKECLINSLKSKSLRYLLEDVIEIENLLLEIRSIERKMGKNSNLLRESIESLKKQKITLQKKFLKTNYELQLLSKLMNPAYEDELNKFSKLLYFRKAKKIKGLQDQIHWERLLDIFPIWIAEIRNIGEVLPMKAGLFDLVIVDEASQVNLAEILPVFYRGKQICIVGDHKQLSLISTGLNFQLSSRLDRFTWEKYKPAGLDYLTARKRNLTVTTASILDFIRSEENNFNIIETMLDEHFRSLPAMASFTNNKFYDGKLKIMTETPDKALVNCFKPIRVNGERDPLDRTIKEEAQKVLEILKQLTEDSSAIHRFNLPEFIPFPYSIGIISIIREQVELIKDLVEMKLGRDTIDKYQLIVGTPEELQGHERDIIIFSLCLDKNSSRSASFYQNKNRFNVATSRAKYFTFLVYSDIPSNFDLIYSYIKHFGFEPKTVEVSIEEISNPLGWKFDPMAYESEFEKVVYEYLEKYINERKNKADIKIFNQVKACGQKRLDFVLYNPSNRKFVAIEVDGIHHFDVGGRRYSEAHIERIETLKRAGWKIINTPYYKWYKNGKLNLNSQEFKREIERIYNELDKILFLSSQCT